MPTVEKSIFMVTYILISVLLLLAELVYFRIADKYNIIDKPNQRSSHTTIVLRGGGIIFLIGAWVWSAFFGFEYYVGATNVINFMDGINGITAGYSLAVLLPLAALNTDNEYVAQSLIVTTIIAAIVFCIFNFRPKGKAKCFAGDVGSIGIAFIILFLLGNVIIKTEDITWLIFLLVYGVDGCLTIIHRIMLHENLGEAHRKHAYQIMANELKIGHVKVTLLYMAMQLTVSLGFVYLCPNTALCHWMYLIGAFAVLAIAYVLFMKKYYHLHEEYLNSLKK